MAFSSTLFLVYFLPLFLGLYFLAAKRFKNALLLCASLLLYSWVEPVFVFLVLGSAIIDFYVVNALHKALTLKGRRMFLFLSTGINLAVLLVFKYGNFLQENIQSIRGVDTILWTDIAVPLGISFFTFQSLSYTIDVYRKQTEPLPKLRNYILYIFSFPQLIAGPIVRFGKVRDQIENRTETIDDKLIGFYRFCIGLVKKVLIADILEQQVDLIFNLGITELSTEMAWIGAIAFTFQIYFDFSAYSDMAIGLGRMMGFRFPENFNSPFVAKSITEFWRRWHMTLTDFMRDYLYIPLGGNRNNAKWKMYRNLWLVFIVTGIWHGAAWNFLLWGIYHGIFLILDKFFLKKLMDRLGFLSILLTFFIVMLGCVIFKLHSVDDLWNYSVVLFNGGADVALRIVPSFIPIVSVAAFFSVLPAFKIGAKLEHFFFQRERYTLPQNIGLTLGAIFAFILVLSMVVATEPSPFIYFKF